MNFQPYNCKTKGGGGKKGEELCFSQTSSPNSKKSNRDLNIPQIIEAINRFALGSATIILSDN